MTNVRVNEIRNESLQNIQIFGPCKLCNEYRMSVEMMQLIPLQWWWWWWCTLRGKVSIPATRARGCR